MDLDLTLVGLSHRTAPLEIRERYVVGPADLPACLQALARVEGVREAYLLSTCNRTEALVVGEPGADLAPRVRAHLLRNLPDQHVYVWRGVQALIHVFRVSAGLDSLVVGESEVLGQMKRGLEIARQSGSLGVLLEPLLQQALRVGKRVRSETEVGLGTLSLARVAVDVAARAFGRFESRKALIVGAGETGILVARNLLEGGLREPIFANRTLERAEEVAAALGGRAHGLADLARLVTEADVVVTCVEGQPGLLEARMFVPRRLRARDRPLLAIDLSVPRAIDRSVAELPNVLLYDIDDLQKVVSENRRGRSEAALRTAEILVSELHKFLALRTYASLSPVIASMRERFESVRDGVLDSVAGASSDKKDLQLAHELASRLLDVALDHMKEGARATSSEAAIGREYRRFLDRLGAEERA